MTGRERILKTLKHEEPDKVPVDCGATHSSGITAMAYNRLKDRLGIAEGCTVMADMVQQLCYPESWYLERFQVDVIDLASFFIDSAAWVDWTLHDGSAVRRPKWHTIEKRGDTWVVVHTDGEILAKMPASSFCFDQTFWPLRGQESADFEDLPRHMDKVVWKHLSDPLWRNAGREDFYEVLRDGARSCYEQTDRAVMVTFGGNLFEWGQFLYGIDEFLINLLDRRHDMERFLDRLTELHIRNLEPLLDAVAPYVQIIKMGDDLGTQTGPMLSPKLYRDLFFPRHKEIFGTVKRKTDLPVLLHSCGAIADLIPDLIEAGVDIINPVQIAARGMDPEHLKREYGKDLVFWGGGVDTQRVLPLGTPEEVRADVMKNAESLMDGGGFVFNPVHNILTEVPPENITAMYEEINSIRY
jgi:uroporphyrinogen decarboxylase